MRSVTREFNVSADRVSLSADSRLNNGCNTYSRSMVEGSVRKLLVTGKRTPELVERITI